MFERVSKAASDKEKKSLETKFMASFVKIIRFPDEKKILHQFLLLILMYVVSYSIQKKMWRFSPRKPMQGKPIDPIYKKGVKYTYVVKTYRFSIFLFKQTSISI